MPWQNSWFQLAVFAALFSGGLLVSDLGSGVSHILPSLPASLISSKTPVAGKEWTNSLGMKFVPAGSNNVLFCTYDVRVEDFQTYVQATGYRQPPGIWVMKVKKNQQGNYTTTWEVDMNATWSHPGFEQEPTHPVVGVSWVEAAAYCEWLTKKEQAEGKLGGNQMYRLPTDAEWSAAVGNATYPWGEQWPPPNDAGNYGDQAYASSLPGSGWNVLPENDGYPRTNPVGSFRANSYGLYDMGGNVWQWCMDWYQASMNSEEMRQKDSSLNNDGGGEKYKLFRGGSWFVSNPMWVCSALRSCGTPDYKAGSVGFRLVVVASP